MLKHKKVRKNLLTLRSNRNKMEKKGGENFMKISLKACRANVRATAREMADFVGVSEDTV